MKPILFIDVDGVLIGLYDGYLQIRPNVIGFLDWCSKHFECVWLSCRMDSFARLADIPLPQGGEMLRKIKTCKWNRNKAEAALKYANKRQFYWIEDGLLDEEVETLLDAGFMNNFLWVNPEGRDELYLTQKRLAEKIEVKLDVH